MISNSSIFLSPTAVRLRYLIQLVLVVTSPIFTIWLALDRPDGMQAYAAIVVIVLLAAGVAIFVLRDDGTTSEKKSARRGAVRDFHLKEVDNFATIVILGVPAVLIAAFLLFKPGAEDVPLGLAFALVVTLGLAVRTVCHALMAEEKALALASGHERPVARKADESGA